MRRRRLIVRPGNLPHRESLFRRERQTEKATHPSVAIQFDQVHARTIAAHVADQCQGAKLRCCNRRRRPYAPWPGPDATACECGAGRACRQRPNSHGNFCSRAAPCPSADKPLLLTVCKTSEAVERFRATNLTAARTCRSAPLQGPVRRCKLGKKQNCWPFPCTRLRIASIPQRCRS